MKQSEILNTQSNTEETLNKNSHLTTNEPIEETPFRLVGNTETGYAITMGKYRLTKWTKTKEEALNKLETESWNIIANMIVVINEQKELYEIEKEPSYDKVIGDGGK